MGFELDEVRERHKKYIRDMQDDKIIETMRVFSLSVAQMDRAELLGVICWLVKNRSQLVKSSSGSETLSATPLPLEK